MKTVIIWTFEVEWFTIFFCLILNFYMNPNISLYILMMNYLQYAHHPQHKTFRKIDEN